MELLASVLTFTAINVVAVTGVFILTGLTGLFSLGQGAFMGIGAYVAGLMAIKYNFSFPLAACGAVVVGLIAAVIVGLPTIRLRRDYISLVTLGFGEAIAALLNQSVNITGGAMGLSGIPKQTTLLLAVTSAVICLLLVWGFKCSRYGRQCLALRSDELAARSMGINVNQVKMVAFLLSAAITTYAGVLYGFYTTYVEPVMFGWTKSAEWIIMVFFGGINSLTGAVVASALLTGLPEILRAAAEWRIVAYCVIVLLILNFKPTGLFGEYEISLLSLLRRRGNRIREGEGS
ncbi:ABC transporter [Moorella sp. E308F]|uniref:branched-chain amino acid ABC transporter permease n=1 Tax=unclassified Neomoorella TaxID=2676739 RepID=UPI0010FFB02C|nr:MULTISPECIES: branched-chain amino acid ABC transporter permease [unclassified Moorella (in: firmicutes)]GEA16026.1 ABC transporter [Moorella sp. E308F]GEA19131.1 ABC transporter [Moorella sp. E306M]